MGQITPNIGIYIPAAGETNYDTSFAAGMINIDQHDHSGGPNKGVRISTSGLDDGSVTFNKLNANVADNTTGIGTAVGPFANQLIMLGLLKSIFQLGSDGLIVKNGTLALARTITGTANQITVTNGDGVAGNPTLSLPTTFFVEANFVPTIDSNGGGLGAITYTTQEGRYQRIGNWILFDITLEFSVAAGSVAGEALRVSSLPFAASTANYWTAGYWSDTTNQATASYAIEPTNTFFEIFLDGVLNTKDESVAGAFARNIQYTGLYRIA